MRPILRTIGAVLAGVIAGGIVIALVEMLSQLIVAAPEGMDPADPAGMRSRMAELPAGAFLLVLLAWALGSLVGGLVAARLAPNAPRGHAIAVGLLLLAAGVANMVMLPHPGWMWLGALIVFVPGALLGERVLATRRR